MTDVGTDAIPALMRRNLFEVFGGRITRFWVFVETP